MSEIIRKIAFYLPQYHQIEENNIWWGPGFTEWTNVGNAKSLFKGHYQPKVPRDLGYYDLRVDETREQQAHLARIAGVNGFCYWHYWFGGGKRLLEKPIENVLDSGKPDFPFCFGWANHSWQRKMWSPAGSVDETLIEQSYPAGDVDKHFYNNLRAFRDNRYIKIDGKPLFLIWDSDHLPDGYNIVERWNSLAIENGLLGVYFVAFSFTTSNFGRIQKLGFDAICYDSIKDIFNIHNPILRKFKHGLRKIFGLPNKISYDKYAHNYKRTFPNSSMVIPCIYPNFDHTPRSGKFGRLLTGSDPNKFCNLLDQIVEIQQWKDNESNKLCFIKSWNEWGEGNYLEPDLLHVDSFIKEMNRRYHTK